MRGAGSSRDPLPSRLKNHAAVPKGIKIKKTNISLSKFLKAPHPGNKAQRKSVSASKFPLLDRRGGCAIKKKAAFLAGADGVVDQPPKQ